MLCYALVNKAFLVRNDPFPITMPEAETHNLSPFSAQSWSELDSMDGGQQIWCPHPTEGYQLGQIVDVGADTLTVEPLASPQQVSDL